MKRFLGLLAFLCAAAVNAQTPYAGSIADHSISKGGGLAIPAGYFVIRDEGGAALTARTTINCVGAGIACTDDAVHGWTTITVGGGAATTLANDVLWNAAGDLAYATGNDAGAILPAGTATQVFHSGATPSWSSVVNGDIAASTIDLTTKVTGVLPVANGGTGAGTHTIHGVMVGNAASAESTTAAGTAGQVLTSNGASSDPTYQAAPAAPDFDTSAWMRDDFLCGNSASSATVIGSCAGNAPTNTSGTAGTFATPDSNSPGWAFISSSTSASGISAFGTPQASTVLISGTEMSRSRVRLSALSTTADEYTVWFGMCNASFTTNATCTKGAWFTYHNTTLAATPNWAIHTGKTVGGATTTDADCGIAVAATTNTKLKITYASGVGFHYFVDGVECSNSPINTTLPTAAGDETRPYYFKIAKAAGTTQIDYQIDYVEWTKTVAR